MSEEVADLNTNMIGDMEAEESYPERKMDISSPDPTPAPKGSGVASFDMLMDVQLQLTVELGRTELSVRQVLDLQKGSVVELDRVAGDAVDIFVNEHLIARGEVVVVDDKFGVRITELVSPVREGVEATL